MATITVSRFYVTMSQWRLQRYQGCVWLTCSKVTFLRACLLPVHCGHWFIGKTEEKSKMDWPSLRKSRGSEGRWPEFMLLPFPWLLKRLQSLKECEKVAWGFDKQGRDLRKRVERGKEGKTIRNEKDLGMHFRLPSERFCSFFFFFSRVCLCSRKRV